MRFEFGVAKPEDDAAIRDLLARNPMPGTVTVAFEREPAYFLGHGVMGDRCTTLKAVESATGTLTGIMCVAAADRFVSGNVRPVGYVGQIRIAEQYRGYLMPMRAAAYIRSYVSTGGRICGSVRLWTEIPSQSRCSPRDHARRSHRSRQFRKYILSAYSRGPGMPNASEGCLQLGPGGVAVRPVAGPSRSSAATT